MCVSEYSTINILYTSDKLFALVLLFHDYSMYLRILLRSVHPHHVVSEKLLKELHLGNAEVEIQTAGHIYLQRVATHHHLLERDEGDSTGGNE